ncbi:MAG: GPW/gp25 family protein [Bacteroidota bacterium]
METEKLLGIGWSFPPSFDNQSNSPEMLNGVADVENSIYVILHTKLGERIMRRDFGSNIHELMFEPLSHNMKTYMAATLSEALVLNEPRIEIEDLKLEQTDSFEGKVLISISYLIIETQTAGNLIVPYSLTENFS